jgi:uncharacterized protein DUF4397
MRLSVRSGVLIASLLAALAAPAAAFGDAQVRFVHAVPMLGKASLAVDGHEIGQAGFAQATDFASVPSGNARLVVSLDGKPVLRARRDLADGGRYSVVAMAAKPAELRIFRDDAAAAGVARMRVIHAAPELGMPDLAVDGKVVTRRLAYTKATPYWGLPPGTHTLKVTSPSGRSVVAPDQLPLAAGTASTVLVVGSGGERVRPLVLTDAETAPGSAPQTGLGGLAQSPGPNWTLAAIAALAAGAAGLGAYRLLARRRHLPRA